MTRRVLLTAGGLTLLGIYSVAREEPPVLRLLEKYRVTATFAALTYVIPHLLAAGYHFRTP